MSFKNRGRKKEYVGKAIDSIKHQPQYAWRKGKLIEVGNGVVGR